MKLFSPKKSSCKNCRPFSFPPAFLLQNLRFFYNAKFLSPFIDFNDWNSTPIIHKSFIKNFEFLSSNFLITHLEDNNFYLNIESANIEALFYSKKYNELATKLNIKDVGKEIKQFIFQLNTYNE